MKNMTPEERVAKAVMDGMEKCTRNPDTLMAGCMLAMADSVHHIASAIGHTDPDAADAHYSLAARFAQIASLRAKLAEEIEAHAETRKRLLKLHFRVYGRVGTLNDNRPNIAAGIVECGSARNLNDMERDDFVRWRKRIIRSASEARRVMHATGHGVPG